MILSRQPAERIRSFFAKYQDRILYGTDFAPHVPVQEDEHELLEYVRWDIDTYRKEFRYFAGSGTVAIWGREVDCLALPRVVLEKIYHRNALRLIPGLAE